MNEANTAIALQPAPPQPSGADNALLDTLRQRLVVEKLDLPPLPQVANQVLGLASDESADAARLAALVHRDPALAGQVLRIANSPAYLPRSPIVSLQQAVTRLGLDALVEIAVSACLQGDVFKAPGLDSELRFVWLHSVASATYAKEIARLRRSNVESAYLCGLMHEIGKPLVLRALSDELRAGAAKPAPEQLAGVVDALHVECGRLLAEKWMLPNAVCQALIYHRRYGEAGSCANEARVTCLADVLATHVLAPQTPDEPQLAEHPVFADLNLYPEDIDALLLKADRVRAVAAAMVL